MLPPSLTKIPFPLLSSSSNPAPSLARTLSVNKYLPSAIPRCSLEFHELDAFVHLNSLSVAPFKVIPPPSAVVFVGVSTDPSSIFLSSTVSVVELTVVVVPLTVRSPSTTRSSLKFPDPSTIRFPERTLSPAIDKSSPTFKLFSISKLVVATIRSPVE